MQRGSPNGSTCTGLYFVKKLNKIHHHGDVSTGLETEGGRAVLHESYFETFQLLCRAAKPPTPALIFAPAGWNRCCGTLQHHQTR